MSAGPGSGLLVFDGTCALCVASARFVCANDPGGRFRFATQQSEAGARALRDCGYARTAGDAASLTTVVLVADGRCLTRSDAILRVCSGLRAPWNALSLLAGLPRPLRDGLYAVFVRSRFALFGRARTGVPAGDFAERFVAGGVSG